MKCPAENISRCILFLRFVTVFVICILQIADIEDKQACFENGFTAEMFTLGKTCIKLIVTGQSMQL